MSRLHIVIGHRYQFREFAVSKSELSPKLHRLLHLITRRGGSDAQRESRRSSRCKFHSRNWSSPTKAKQMYSKCKDRILTRARVLVLAFRKPHATGRGVDLSHESSPEQKAKSNVKFRGGNSPILSLLSAFLFFSQGRRQDLAIERVVVGSRTLDPDSRGEGEDGTFPRTRKRMSRRWRRMVRGYGKWGREVTRWMRGANFKWLSLFSKVELPKGLSGAPRLRLPPSSRIHPILVSLRRFHPSNHLRHLPPRARCAVYKPRLNRNGTSFELFLDSENAWCFHGRNTGANTAFACCDEFFMNFRAPLCCVEEKS